MNAPLPRSLLAGLVATAALAPAATAAAKPPQPPTVPTPVQVDAGHKPFLSAHAVGVQIYSCAPGTAAPAWTLSAPRADLFDDKGRKVISHYGGPSWRHKDGSTITAKRVDGVTVDPTAIPWLKLAATPAPNPAAHGDRLTGTTFIQRIATTGGLAPAAATCTTETLGAVEEVPYTADYVFWKRRG